MKVDQEQNLLKSRPVLGPRAWPWTGLTYSEWTPQLMWGLDDFPLLFFSPLTFVTVHITVFFRFSSCRLFIIAAWLSISIYPSECLSHSGTVVFLCFFVFFNLFPKSLCPRARSVWVRIFQFFLSCMKHKTFSPSVQCKVSDHSIILRTQGLCHRGGCWCEMCVFVCAAVQPTVGQASERKALFVFHS